MMIDDIKEFFDRFVDDFSLFDGAILANHYQAPYLAVSPDGDIWQCSAQSEVADYLQSLLDRHSSQGVRSCTCTEIESTPIGKSCALVSVTWSMKGEDNKVILSWRESYNLVKTDAGIKIFTSIDH